MVAIQLTNRTDGVSVLTFDHPDRRANVLSESVWREFQAHLQSLSTRDDVRGLVLASAKPGIFIAGADLKYFAAVPAPNDPGVAAIVALGLDTLNLLETLPFPTIAAIDGAALGGGLEVALACDSRLAGTNPRIELGLPETRLGLIPGWGGTQRLPRTIGLDLAMDMIANARSLTAEEAREAGLVSAIVQSEALVDFAARHVLLEGWEETRKTRRSAMPDHALARFRAPVPSGPPAVREAMMLLNQGPELPLEEALKLESAAFLRVTGSEDARAKIAEFFKSRKPG